MSSAQPSTNELEQAALQQIRSGDFAAATRLYRQAIAQGDASAAACSNLAALHIKAGNLEGAVELLQQVLQRAPGNAEAWLNLGTAQHGLHHYGPAIASFRRATSLKPVLVKAHANLGHALLADNEPQQALQAYEAALALQPGQPELLSGRGMALRALERFNDSINSLQRALSLKGPSPELLNNLGLSLQAAGRCPEAMACFEQAITLSPNQPEIHSNLGLAHLEQGRIPEAAACFQQALQLDPLYPEAHRHLAYCIDGRLDPLPEQRAIASLASLQEHPKRYHLQFSIGKYKLDRLEPDAAAWFSEANRVRSEQLQGRWTLPELRTLLELNHSVVRQANRQTSAQPLPQNNAGGTTPALLFIVGLPRSGSTLVETILSQNQQLLDLGEVSHLPKALEQSLSIESIRRHYLEAATAHPQFTPEIQAISDKFLYNFAHCQILDVVFPGCRILHVHRNPMDNIWSTFTNHFTTSNEWTYNLEQSVAFYHLYRQVMAAHEQAMPGRIHHINYDQLTRSPQTEIPRLIAACGWAWDEAYLHPERSGRQIHTASVVQARSPISSRSVGRWQHYRELLQPYADQLESLGYSTAIEPVA